MRLNTLTSFLLLFPFLAFAAEDFTVYRAKFRPASELVELARPLFPAATFSSMDEKVVVNAPKETATKVLQLFGDLDRKRRSYRIAVRLQAAAQGENDAIGLGTDGLRVESESAEAKGNTIQTVTVTEGRSALLRLGQGRATGGFLAKVRSAPKDSVLLELSQKEPGTRGLALETELTVKLNEWQSVGKLDESQNAKESRILGKGSAQGASRKLVQVKVSITD